LSSASAVYAALIGDILVGLFHPASSRASRSTAKTAQHK
jgi:hypothetical protein